MQAQNKKLRIEANNVAIGEILNRIEQQTDYNIAYSCTLLDKSIKVTLQEPKGTVEQVLRQILKGTGCTYRLNGAYIFIEREAEEIATRILKGIVIDDKTSTVIAGADIQITGHTSLRAKSDQSGMFTIKEVPVGDHSVRVEAQHYLSANLGISVSQAKDATIRVRLIDTRQTNEIKAHVNSTDVVVEDRTEQQAVETIEQSIVSRSLVENNSERKKQTVAKSNGNKTNDTIASEDKESVLVATNILSQKSAEKETKPYRPLLAEKVNLLYLATTSLNIGAELALSDKWTIDATFGYNPWKFGDGKIKHWLIMPELRYWLCQSFEGHFFGLHGIYSKFNVGNLSFISSLKDYSYQGSMYGGGISYGYHFPLSGRWGLELTAGIGYLRLDYDKFVMPIDIATSIIVSVVTLVGLYFWTDRKRRMAQRYDFIEDARAYLNNKIVLISLFFLFLYPVIIVMVSLLFGFRPGDTEYFLVVMGIFIFFGWIPTTILIQMQKGRLVGTMPSNREPFVQQRSPSESLRNLNDSLTGLNNVLQTLQQRTQQQTTTNQRSSQQQTNSPKININTATSAQIRELSTLLTIVEVNRIVKERDTNGDYKNLRELQRRTDLSTNILDQISPNLNFDPSSKTPSNPKGRTVDF